MGLLDAPAIGPVRVGREVSNALINGQRDVNICVIADSTGADTVELGTGSDRRWVYLTAAAIAAKFPAYTVRHLQWNGTTSVYDAATVIQTGSGTTNAGGPFTLSVYGAARSGATSAYWTGVMAAVPPAPTFPTAATPFDLILISDGHNETGKGISARDPFTALIKAVRYTAPGVPIGLVTQNPQNGAGSSSSAAEQANQLLRMEALRQLAASEGLGLIDVQPAFLADASYASDYLNADGIHPNATGSQLWANTVAAHFPAARDTQLQEIGGPNHPLTRIWLPATLFAASEGAPTLTKPSTLRVPVWSLPNGSLSAIATTVDFPPHWRTMNADVHYTTDTNSTNNWRGRLNGIRIGSTLLGDTTGSGLTLAATPSNGSTVSMAGRATINQMNVIQVVGGVDLVTGYNGRPFMLEMERLGTDGADLLATPVLVLGVSLHRVT